MNTHQRIVEILRKESGLTADDLARRLNASPTTVRQYLSLMKRQGEAYISGWRGATATPSAEYTLGPGRNVARPQGIYNDPAAVLSRRRELRKKKQLNAEQRNNYIKSERITWAGFPV